MLEASNANTRDCESLSFAPKVPGFASNLEVSFHRVCFLISPLNFAFSLTYLPHSSRVLLGYTHSTSHPGQKPTTTHPFPGNQKSLCLPAVVSETKSLAQGA